jgi:predicted transcriptional regulator of viral defense system
MHGQKFISGLTANGRYSFTTEEAIKALDASPVAARAALRRLRQKGELAMPYKGFYVIVPPEFRNIGCLPASHFIPDLMNHLGEKYYAGLLTAAEYHGAAHQRPQVFQVIAAKNKPQIICGKVRVEFIARKNMEKIPTLDFKTPRGYLKISTSAATAFDLVGYPHHAAGLDNVATILSELAEKLDGDELRRIAELSPIAWTQRLGYLLELVEAQDKTETLAEYIAQKKAVVVPLVRSQPCRGIGSLKRWRMIVNTKVEAEV